MMHGPDLRDARPQTLLGMPVVHAPADPSTPPAVIRFAASLEAARGGVPPAPPTPTPPAGKTAADEFGSNRRARRAAKAAARRAARKAGR